MTGPADLASWSGDPSPSKVNNGVEECCAYTDCQQDICLVAWSL
jgi:hypothetical protein